MNVYICYSHGVGPRTGRRIQASAPPYSPYGHFRQHPQAVHHHFLPVEADKDSWDDIAGLGFPPCCVLLLDVIIGGFESLGQAQCRGWGSAEEGGVLFSELLPAGARNQWRHPSETELRKPPTAPLSSFTPLGLCHHITVVRIRLRRSRLSSPLAGNIWGAVAEIVQHHASV